MTTKMLKFGDSSFELLTDGDSFLGLGAITIGDTVVRSGRLPLRPFTQSFSGNQLSALKLRGVDAGADELRIRLTAEFSPMPVKVMRDHSFDPIHELGDWNSPVISGLGEIDIVIKKAADSFNGVEFAGFSYHYEYDSKDIALFYLLDMASWELGGDVVGSTVYTQSSCSPPVVKFDNDTVWSTEGFLFFLVDGGQNPVMTHNLPRWAGHGSFDFQFKGDVTMVGIFERVELIRSVVCRDANKSELKTFDKHLFDNANKYSTSAKSIMINKGTKTITDQQNIWTWVSEEVDNRARAEYGIKEEPLVVDLHQNFWRNFQIEDYYKDLVPAAANIGAKRIFVDNLKKSSMTEDAPLKGKWQWNMCCGHEYEIADMFGGNAGVKAFNEKCAEQDVQVMIWTNNDQALSSPVNSSERDDKGWYVLLEDARMKYGGAYAGCMSVLDFANPDALNYFIDSHLKIKEETGVNAFFFDSFYNLGFMPINYRNCSPRTMWKGLLTMVKSFQDNGINLEIESFGPFGKPCHGHPSTYNMDTIFICYRVGLGNDYTTVPTNNPIVVQKDVSLPADFYSLAHKAGLASGGLFNSDKVRIDQRWTPDHVRMLKTYHDNLEAMHTRYLQEDGLAVIWHNADKTQAIIWNFTDRNVKLPGVVTNMTTGEKLTGGEYSVKTNNIYSVTGVELPTGI
jgi:hypothetical protein